MSSVRSLLLVSAMLTVAGAARAQDAAPPPPPQEEERPTGLPKALEWTFNFDAGWGTFGFQNSLFTNPKEEVEESLSDQWFEGYVKPALSGSYTGSHGVLYGKVSAVGERTYGSAPELVGTDVSSFQAEDLYIGWRSGDTLDLGEDALDFTIGRSQYRLGTGFLLYDGAAKAAAAAATGPTRARRSSLPPSADSRPAHHKAEAFYLDKDELEENDSGSRLWGANYEFTFGEESTVGATYMKWFADIEFRPERDGLNVYDFRAAVAPVPSVADLTVEFEYARESNGDALDSYGWYAQAAYQLSDVAWTPKLSYRYAFFQGDDLETPENEAFDPLFLGFYDWGTWWQGEIAGEYFLSNSNLISHEVRVHTTPTESIGTGLSTSTSISISLRRSRPASPPPTWRTNSTGTWTGSSTRTSRSVSSPPTPTRAGRSSRPSTGRRTSPTE